MIRKISFTVCALLLAVSGFSQEVEFTEYDLDNGLHVILHQNNSAPVITVGVMYHVGGKDEEVGRSGSPIFLSTCFLKGPKTSAAANGST